MDVDDEDDTTIYDLQIVKPAENSVLASFPSLPPIAAQEYKVWPVSIVSHN